MWSPESKGAGLLAVAMKQINELQCLPGNKTMGN